MEKKTYYIVLSAFEKKATKGYGGPDEVRAHFTSEHKPATPNFVNEMQNAIDLYYNQNKRYWNGYVVGKLFVQTGREPVSVMSPAWDYHKCRTFPVYEEV